MFNWAYRSYDIQSNMSSKITMDRSWFWSFKTGGLLVKMISFCMFVVGTHKTSTFISGGLWLQMIFSTGFTVYSEVIDHVAKVCLYSYRKTLWDALWEKTLYMKEGNKCQNAIMGKNISVQRVFRYVHVNGKILNGRICFSFKVFNCFLVQTYNSAIFLYK